MWQLDPIFYFYQLFMWNKQTLSAGISLLVKTARRMVMSCLYNSLTMPLWFSQLFEVTFGESFRVASDDNGRKPDCASATARFHCVMCFQWHPGWCAVVFSFHCNSDSKTVCLIVLWSFHVLHKARKVGQGNDCFVLWTQRIGTLWNPAADNNTLMVLIS